MSDVFRRITRGVWIAVLPLLPASGSAQVLLIPPASAVPGQRWTAAPTWPSRDMSPRGQHMPPWSFLQPLASSGTPRLARPPAAPDDLAILNNGFPASSRLNLMSGAGNGNGNGNVGSNNGNGNRTNGNGNFGVGDGVGNGGAPFSQD